MKKFKVILFYALLIGAVLLAVSGIFRDAEGEVQLLENYSDVITLFKEEKVKEFTVSEDLELYMILADDTKAL